MTAAELNQYIKNLNIPGKTRDAVRAMWDATRRLLAAIPPFLGRHRSFIEILVVGSVVAFLLAHIPGLGDVLAICALSAAAVVGLIRELFNTLVEDIP